ncbi:crooked neck pre-mRNA splicing factor 1 [Homo sapiens]|uniref:Crooked neck-like protein 1 n=2 Tax=Homo sapiens TaxID=9606 RepID=Q5JY65_HUMAN|nr:crooked neck-like protein 1 isoform b [Homo sapiens]KAI2594209.1 crooked neck pre-mRNA splicing factor 1 [Homo sapiens]KAI4004917.1 crooked neck pre-mRNA splicing factor 1 [Homo sapiens]|eukprot:NP_001265554.1 crooked neck-like protein 1 isoform b [Homo sapiens]
MTATVENLTFQKDTLGNAVDKNRRHGSTEPLVLAWSSQFRRLTWGCALDALHRSPCVAASQHGVTHLIRSSRTPHSTRCRKEDAQPGHHGNGAASVTAQARGQRSVLQVPLPVPRSCLFSESFVVSVSSQSRFLASVPGTGVQRSTAADMAASTAAGKQRIPKVAKVKNKAPAEVQITAEQLLREAKERELELLPPPPQQKITDEEELNDYKLRKRKTFEDNIRKNRTVISNWIKYAQWEESLKEIQRARSIYERALDVDYRNITLWLKYAEMEMKNRQVNHARNIWDRAITTLPRVNQFWYKYTYMEEMLGNVAGARQVFERWMEWQPEEQAWHSYINFELRYKEVDRARTIYERFVLVHPDVKNWIKYARFEEKHAYFAHARKVYERAVEFFGDEHMDEHLYVAFAKFEENQKEFERVRVIYKYALDRISKQDAQELFKNYTIFEKKFGDRRGIEDIIVSKRRFQYEEEVKANPHNYDAWFDYLRLVESDAEAEAVREVYERAIANVPPIQEKRHWKRYIYLWINYALYEELEAKDPERTRQVYQASLELIPHKKFTFAKMWILYAQFEIRQKNLSLARRALGTSIGKCPKNKLFKVYIELELQLREFDRCRKLYEKFLEFGPENCTSWIKFAELETILGDIDRARAIYELAISQPRLDMPEVLWKSYIDFEIEQEETERTRNLYRRLLQRTQHVKVWISFAQFELSSGKEGSLTKCRQIYEEANKTMRNCEEKEERLMLLESWRSFEEEFGTASDKERVDKLMPEKVKKRRKVQTDDGSDAGWEEYFDYIFPEDAANQPNLKLLAMAKLWKKQQQEKEDAEHHPDEDVDESES